MTKNGCFSVSFLNFFPMVSQRHLPSKKATAHFMQIKFLLRGNELDFLMVVKAQFQFFFQFYYIDFLHFSTSETGCFIAC